MAQVIIIKELVIIFAVSLLIIFLFRKIKLPTITGFLIAGIIIGPYGLKFITELEHIEVMAEIGVILLLFTIGLEISIGKLLSMKKLLLLAGGIQILLTVLICSVLFIGLGFSIKQSIFFGMLVSLSSTAIVLKLLADKNEIHAPHGKMALIILIFQDLAIVPMMFFLPMLGTGTDISFPDLLLKLFLSFLILTAVVVLAKFLMPKILHHLARLRIREAFTIGVILMIISTAYFTQAIGLSLALGAFIAGIILSESEFSHQVIAEVIPLKDAFNSLFFVSIGLLLNYSFVAEFPLLLLSLTIGIILLKSILIIAIVLFLKYPVRTAILTAFSLAQIGEFSFVLALAGMKYNLFQQYYYNAFIASSIFTMLLTPLLLQISPKIALKFKDMQFSKFPTEEDKKESMDLKNHVIIVGFGVNGRNVARVLKETGIKYIVVDLNPDTVEKYKAKKESIIYGDVTKKDVLHQLKVETANIMVIAISDPDSSRIVIRQAKEMNPSIHCIVRTRFISEVDELIKMGADEVIPEEFETSLQIFGKVLEKYHIPLNIIMKQMNIIRGESYEMLRKEPAGVHPFSHIDKILAEGITEVYFVEEDNLNLRRSFRELNIRALTGATIIAILRDGKTHPNPAGYERIRAGDTLVIYGNHMAVDKAITLLNAPKST